MILYKTSYSDEGSTVKLSTPGQRRNPFQNWEFYLIAGILLVAALAHGINMFHFPYLEDDEGTYISQAWAVVHLGRLAYYYYWYDHAPFGWIQIAFWTIISGGFNTFGSAIDSGRVLMLLMQIGSTFMLYRIARNVSGRVTVAVIASLLFALSPYGIYFHRRVLLDNIATFWMLLSILALVGKRLSLKRVWVSAVALGISMLSKEVTFVLVPVMWYLVFARADKSHRLLATLGWTVLLASVVSLYPLMAGINNELLPSGPLFSGTFPPRITLISILAYQASKGKDAGIFSLQSGFWLTTKQWISQDPLLVVVGTLCSVISVVMIKRQRLIGIMGLLSLSLWAFMARGGIVLVYYLLPLLPLLALNAGIILGMAVEKVRLFVQGLARGNKAVGLLIQLMLAIVCIAGITGGYFSSNLGFQYNHLLPWNNPQADAQYQAIVWVEEHIPHDSYLVIDMYMWPDLYENGYQHAHYYWKVATDPAIGGTIFGNSWKNIDYIITTNQMLNDAQFSNMKIIEDAVAHSTIVAQFDTGNWPVIIRKVHK